MKSGYHYIMDAKCQGFPAFSVVFFFFFVFN